MAMNDYLYIGVGSGSHYFTLREVYHDIRNTGVGYIRKEHHIKNLSQDAAEAVEKAKAYAAETNLPLRNPVPEFLEREMCEIHRETAEEVARRHEAATRAAEENAAARERLDAQLMEVVAAGFVPVGRYTGESIESLPLSYLTWLANNADDFTSTVMRGLAEKVASDYTEYLLPEPDLFAKLDAEVGARVTLTATITRKTGYNSMYGWTNVITLVTDDGVCVVQKGRWCPEGEVGSKVTITGSVKGFDEYNGQQQTYLIRVKEK